MIALSKQVPDFFGYMKPASSCCEAAIVSHSVGSEKAWLACSKCHEKLEPTTPSIPSSQSQNHTLKEIK